MAISAIEKCERANEILNQYPLAKPESASFYGRHTMMLLSVECTVDSLMCQQCTTTLTALPGRQWITLPATNPQSVQYTQHVACVLEGALKEVQEEGLLEGLHSAHCVYLPALDALTHPHAVVQANNDHSYLMNAYFLSLVLSAYGLGGFAKLKFNRRRLLKKRRRHYTILKPGAVVAGGLRV